MVHRTGETITATDANGASLTLFTRRGHDWRPKLPAIAEDLSAPPRRP